jgi:hypothetical protein
MRYACMGHTAALLGTGQVLVAGGENSLILSSAQVCDPTASPPAWTTVNPMPGALVGHTATFLPYNGKVLVAGGDNGSSYIPNAYLYDPSTGWSTTTPMHTARGYHTATLLPSGQVLVAGGYNDSTGALSSAELYDPTVTPPTWTPTNPLNTARYDHTATMWPNGQVLVAGGQGNTTYVASAELYVP